MKTAAHPRIAAPSSSDGGAGTAIRISGVTKDYGMPVPAVDDISLEIRPGEFMTFLGPSGSGKTTTLNLIAGFESLTAGTIHLDDLDVSTLPPHKRNLGMLFQNYALFPHMTVAQNIAYPLRERRVPRQEIAAQVRAVLDLVQLGHRASSFPAQLSGGQQQRVALARAIVFHPKVLLLDEPLGALDRNLRSALQLEIKRIHREVGSTFVFVTHDQEEAMSLSDRIALFNEGRLEQVGTPEELYRTPATLFAATFLGESNVFDLDEAGAGWTIDPATVGESATRQGAAASAVIRPEALHLAHPDDSLPAAVNTAHAVIADIEFLGPFRKVVLEFAGSSRLGIARVSAEAFAFRTGDPVVAWWSPSDQRVVA